ncbi:MAG: tetratricopeptide repeat protein [Alphaproteobacteria bacterium]|nr:tetratricopeptide repeat protein [Alphaproteobacteria bacterium]
MPTPGEVLVQAAQLGMRGEHAGAEALLRRLVDARPEEKAAHLLLALAMTNQGKAVDAIPQLRRALCMDPTQELCWRVYGECLVKSGEADQAELAVRCCLALSRNSSWSLRQLTHILVAHERWDEAEALARRLLEPRPFDFDGHYSLGLCLVARKDWANAGSHFLRALAGGLDSRLVPFALLGYGRAMIVSDRLPAAVAALQWSLRFDPDIWEAQTALAAIDSGSGDGAGVADPVYPNQVEAAAEFTDYRGGRTFAQRFRVYARISAKPFGHFIVGHVLAATIKKQFSKAHLTLECELDRPFKHDINTINPYIDELVVSDKSIDGVSGTKGEARVDGPGRRDDRFDFIVHPAMIRDIRLTSYDHAARLMIPDGLNAKLSARLADLGAKPDRWFCTMHFSRKHVGALDSERRARHESRDVSRAGRSDHRSARRTGGQAGPPGHDVLRTDAGIRRSVVGIHHRPGFRGEQIEIHDRHAKRTDGAGFGHARPDDRRQCHEHVGCLAGIRQSVDAAPGHSRRQARVPEPWHEAGYVRDECAEVSHRTLRLQDDQEQQPGNACRSIARLGREHARSGLAIRAADLLDCEGGAVPA